MNEEARTIDLSLEPAMLWICGKCQALTMREDKQLHWEWHKQTETA